MAEVEHSDAPSQQHETPIEAQLSDDDAHEITAEVGAGAEKEKEPSPAEAVTKKENVLPKRLSVAAPRRPVSSSTTSTKPAATATATRPATSGLTKAPTRPPTGSTVRKAMTSATGPTAASSTHKPQVSIGGSGDEKKKSLSGMAKRTSMASTSAAVHHSPPKIGTAAEKRVSMASSTARKPATSVSSPAPKPLVKPALSSSVAKTTAPSTSTGRSVPVSKSAPGAVAEAKKRLSNIAGSPSASARPASMPKPTNSSAPGAALKDIEVVKSRLAESEKIVEGLQKEMEVSQQQKVELQKQIEAESTLINEAQERIRIAHEHMVEKLRAEHTQDVEALQAQLADAKIAQNTAQEASLKAIEQAQVAAALKGAAETAEALERLKADQATGLEVVTSELSSLREASLSNAKAAEDKDAEITSLSAQLENSIENSKLQSEELKTLQVNYDTIVDERKALQVESDIKTGEHKMALETLRNTLEESHSAAAEELKTAHVDALAKGSSEATSAYQTQLEDLKKSHEDTLSHLQKRLEDATLAHAAAETTHEQQTTTLEEVISSLKGAADKHSLELSASRKELKEAKASADAIQADIVASKQKSSDYEVKYLEAQSQASVSKEQMTTLQAMLSETKSELLNVQEQVTSYKQIIETFDKESQDRDEEHSKVVAELSAAQKSLAEREIEISSMLKKHEGELQRIANDHQSKIEVLKVETTAASDLKAKHEQLTLEHVSALKSHADKVEALKQDHTALIKENMSKETAHQKAVEELKATHAKNLDEIHDRALSAGHETHIAELEQLQASHEHSIESLKMEHQTGLAAAHSSMEKSTATTDALKAELSHSSEAYLKAQGELDTLKQELAMEKMAKASAEADLDAARNKKPDTSAVDALRQELQALKAQHQTAIATAHQESSKVTKEYVNTKSDLEKALNDLEKVKADAGAKEITSKSDYKDMHDSMTQLVEEANKKTADLEARLKEMNAQLKVKDAEIAEVKTKLKQPPGLAASMFADEITKSTLGEEEARASVISKQLEMMNNEMKLDNLTALQSVDPILSSSVQD